MRTSSNAHYYKSLSDGKLLYLEIQMNVKENRIVNNKYNGFIQGQLVPLVFIEEVVPGDGDCGFNVLSVTRQELVDTLLPLATDVEARMDLACEIHDAVVANEFSLENDPNWDALMISYNEALDSHNRFIIQILRAIKPVNTPEIDTQESEELLNQFTDLSQKEAIIEHREDLNDAITALINYYQGVAIYRRYIETYRVGAYRGRYTFVMVDDIAALSEDTVVDRALYLTKQGEYCVRDLISKKLIRSKLPENPELKCTVENIQEQKFQASVLMYTCSRNHTHTDNFWIGCYTAKLYAKAKNINLFIWKEKENKELEAVFSTITNRENAQVIHMFQTGRFCHFNRLVPVGSLNMPKQASINQNHPTRIEAKRMLSSFFINMMVKIIKSKEKNPDELTTFFSLIDAYLLPGDFKPVEDAEAINQEYSQRLLKLNKLKLEQFMCQNIILTLDSLKTEFVKSYGPKLDLGSSEFDETVTSKIEYFFEFIIKMEKKYENRALIDKVFKRGLTELIFNREFQGNIPSQIQIRSATPLLSHDLLNTSNGVL